MSILSKLFGSGAPSAPEPVEYGGFLIFPEPAKESGGYRIGARIEKQVGGETRVHKLIRADTYQSLDTAEEAAIAKAKQVIDEQGDRIFG